MDQTTACRETFETPDESWRALPRFLVGSALHGSRELQSRVQAWNAALPASTIPIRSNRDSGHVIRWVLIGLLFESPRILHEQVLPAGQRWAHRWRRRMRFLARLPGGSTLVQQWATLRRQIEAALIHLAEVGRVEEWRSEALAELAWRDLTSTTIATVSEATQIREVVVEQGVTLTQEAAESLRTSAADADSAVENLLHSLLHRRHRTKPPAGPVDPAEELG